MIRFLRDKKGNIALSAALVLPALVGGVGLAVDYSALTSARSQLQQSADAAVLAAAKAAKQDAARRQVYDEVLRANAGAAMMISEAELEIRDSNHLLELTGTATADVNLFFLHQIGQKSVSVKASVAQSTKDVAISLVLDNTGSMGPDGIDALKKASNALIDAVQNNGNGRGDIHMSLVPFVTAVNIKGEGFQDSWIDRDGQSLYNGWSFLNEDLRTQRAQGTRLAELPDDYAAAINDIGQACKNQGNGAPAVEMRELCEKVERAKTYPHAAKLFALSGTTWKGCVEARPAPYNLDLTPPSAARPDTLFVPYFAPDEPEDANTSDGNHKDYYNNRWLSDVVDGSNDVKQRSTLKYVDPVSKIISETKGITHGPNRACPTPVTPLTTDLAKVRAGVKAMQFWNGSGTNIAEGLVWGWRMLTPNAPFPVPSTMRSNDVAKYIVLMTDGRNVAYGAKTTINKSDYGSYGFLASGRIDGLTEQGAAEKKQNAWTSQLCEKVKAQGIEIFTVVYKETDKGVQTLFKQCASKLTNFHMANDTTALQAVFAKIGADMSVLRLTQ